LSLVEGGHPCAFNRADRNKDVIAAVDGLNEAKTLLAIKPLHKVLIQRPAPSTDNVHEASEIGTFVGLIDFLEKGSETCAPV
jgi:hypothetical protein